MFVRKNEQIGMDAPVDTSSGVADPSPPPTARNFNKARLLRTGMAMKFGARLRGIRLSHHAF